MRESLKDFTATPSTTLLKAFQKIDENKAGFVLVVGADETLFGTLTDGDGRRALMRGASIYDTAAIAYNRNFKSLHTTDSVSEAIDIFKNESIKFLPVIDDSGKLQNVITKEELHALLLQDMHVALDYDFRTLDAGVLDHEIFRRPWGFYKTTVMNSYFQSKLISVKPGGKLSLQSHNHREEHWIVAHGEGEVQLDDSVINVRCGNTVYIPKGCRHRLTNTSPHEYLIITEVQIGDYFGEDDIIRYEDVYGRCTLQQDKKSY